MVTRFLRTALPGMWALVPVVLVAVLAGCYPRRTADPTFEGDIHPVTGDSRIDARVSCDVSTTGFIREPYQHFAQLDFKDPKFSLIFLFPESEQGRWSNTEITPVAVYWFLSGEDASYPTEELLRNPASSSRIMPLEGEMALKYRDRNRFHGELDLASKAGDFSLRGTVDSHTGWELDFTPLGMMGLLIFGGATAADAP